MPIFAYKAITDSGSTVSGTIEADSLEAAEEIIAAKGLIPSGVSKKSAALELNIGKEVSFLTTVKATDLILFTKQLRTMLHAGVPVIKCLEVLESQTENKRLRQVVSEIAADLRQGTSLYAAFSKHRKVFPDLYCNMLRAGEHSGTLTDVLERLIYIIQHEYKVKKDISSAMTYPLIVSVMLLGSFLFLLTTVVPKFVGIFKASGITLPVPTQICLLLYNMLAHYWPIVLGGTAAGIAGLVIYMKTPNGRFVRDTILLKLPILGPVFQKAAMSRFASIFSILQSSGVSILDSVKIISGTIGNAAIAREFDNLRDKIREGHGIAGPLKTSKYFPPMVINMIVVGEESGNLDAMLKEISDHYDYEVAHSISRMSELVGPLLMLCMAVVVGFFALAIFMPMWDLTQMVKH